jgi:hypothetical protein
MLIVRWSQGRSNEARWWLVARAIEIVPQAISAAALSSRVIRNIWARPASSIMGRHSSRAKANSEFGRCFGLDCGGLRAEHAKPAAQTAGLFFRKPFGKSRSMLCIRMTAARIVH